MTTYTRRPLLEEAEKEQAEREQHAERDRLDVLTLFGQADRMRDQYSRRVPRKLTLEELEDPRKQWEE